MYIQIIEKKRRLKFLIQLQKNASSAEDAIALLLDWDWRLTACHFFNVDRSLLSGVGLCYQIRFYEMIKRKVCLI